MAKFKQNNVELRDNQKLIFDSAKNKYISYNGSELFINTNISGVEPTEDYHLGTKEYIDSSITTATGSLTTNHSDLNELDYASSGHTGFAATGDLHAESHTIASHSDTTGTGPELDELTDGSETTLHSHAGGSTVFGTEYDYAESEGESSTTSDTYQQKLRLTTSTVPAGTYRIGWAFAHSSSTDKLDCGFKIELDDTTVLSEPTPNMKGKSADGSYYGMSGFKHTSLTNASHTIDIDYIANLDAQAGTTYIKQARIEIWRVV